jgi:hypothetical protein
LKPITLPRKHLVSADDVRKPEVADPGAHETIDGQRALVGLGGPHGMGVHGHQQGDDGKPTEGGGHRRFLQERPRAALRRIDRTRSRTTVTNARAYPTLAGCGPRGLSPTFSLGLLRGRTA